MLIPIQNRHRRGEGSCERRQGCSSDNAIVDAREISINGKDAHVHLASPSKTRRVRRVTASMLTHTLQCQGPRDWFGNRWQICRRAIVSVIDVASAWKDNEMNVSASSSFVPQHAVVAILMTMPKEIWQVPVKSKQIMRKRRKHLQNIHYFFCFWHELLVLV